MVCRTQLLLILWLPFMVLGQRHFPFLFVLLKRRMLIGYHCLHWRTYFVLSVGHAPISKVNPKVHVTSLTNTSNTYNTSSYVFRFSTTDNQTWCSCVLHCATVYPFLALIPVSTVALILIFQFTLKIFLHTLETKSIFSYPFSPHNPLNNIRLEKNGFTS